jgi:zinc protease
MKKIAFLLIVISACALNISAQKNMTEDFRKSAPAPLAPRAFSIGKPFETALKNGLKVVVFEDKRLPLVSYRLAFRAGDINDPADSEGLTSALTQMLSQGTATRTSKQLAEDIERLGATLSANAGADNTIIAGSALKMYSSDVLKLMADMVLNPTFPEKELALYKQNTVENLKFQRSQPGFLADEQVSRILYGKHPYAVVSPTEADIQKITREKLAAFHKQIFVPNNATLIVVGDVNRDELLKELETLFGNWQRGTVAETKFPAPPARSEVTMTIVDRKGSAQSNIVISNLAIPRNHPDYFPVLVMNQILGAGASSRLFMNLREEKGYTYGAYSSFDMKRLAGAFEATAEVRTPVTGDSLKEFFAEMKKIRDQEVSAAELADAKNFLTGVFPIRAETQEGLTNLIVAQQLYDLPADYLQTYRDKISAVTAADVQRVAKQYITPDKVAVVIVGDAEEILKQVKSYTSKIEIYDTEGKMQDIANYGKPSEKPSVDVTGKWNLTLEVQGQQLPVTLTLKQDGEKVSGALDSMLGKGEIAGGKVSGNKVSATATTSVQGQNLELTLNGTVEGEEMKGTITAPMIPTPIPFSGKKGN